MVNINEFQLTEHLMANSTTRKLTAGSIIMILYNGHHLKIKQLTFEQGALNPVGVSFSFKIHSLRSVSGS